MEKKKVLDSEEDVDIDADCCEDDNDIISVRRSRILAAQILDMKCSADEESNNDACITISELTTADGLDLKLRLDSRADEASTDIKKIDAAIESLRMWRVAREMRAKDEANGIFSMDDTEVLSSDFPETADLFEDVVGGFHTRDEQTCEAQSRRLTAQQSESQSAIQTIQSISMLANIRHQKQYEFEQPNLKSQDKLNKIIQELEVMQQVVDFTQVEDTVRLESRRNSTIERLERTVIDEGLDLQMNVASLQANLEAFEKDLALLLK